MKKANLSANAKEGVFLLCALLLSVVLWAGFTYWNIQSATQPVFVGTEQYLKLLLDDPVMKTALFNTHIAPFCYFLPAALVSLIVVHFLKKARPAVRMAGGTIGAAAAAAAVAFACLMMGQRLTLPVSLLAGIGGGLLFLPLGLLGEGLKRVHGIFPPLFRIMASCAGLLLFGLPSRILQIQAYNAFPSGFSWVSSVNQGLGLLCKALLSCLVIWLIAQLCRLIMAVQKNPPAVDGHMEESGEEQ